ncbi:MAG: isochorismate synthase [Bacteroidetes bacterium]|nr:isochorismate synthase [Bacteroidota bacterium]
MKDPVAVFTALLQQREPPYLFWRSPEGEIWITAGQNALPQPPASSSWREWLHRHASDICARDRTVPSFFVFAFAPEQPSQDIWEGFPSAALICPSVAYHQQWDSERFIGTDDIVVPGEDSLPTQSAFPERGQISINDWQAEPYRGAIVQGLHLLQSGILEKIVLARTIRIGLSATFDVRRTLRSLLLQPHAFTLCYSPDGERYFLSATPERLGRVQDGEFSTMALAGTLARETDRVADPDVLLADAKERAEHAYVVEMIQKGAAPFCRELVVDDVRLLDLPHVTHILTRIHGRLADGYGLSDLIASLHPTPAVAGTPRQQACREITRIEGFRRGLYAGCIGWMDAAGNGDAAVAIRSAVVMGKDAWAFAGAGIVRESEPREEERETRAKLQTILDILGS